MRVALIHDWLTGMRGGERCLEEFLNIYPEADIFTLIHVPGATSPKIDRRVKQVSFLNNFPKSKKYYRWLLPLFPFAVRSLKVDGYDLVVSLSHAVAKNVSVPQNSCHVCYCFTPMRYVWDQMLTYFGKLSYVFAPILFLLRIWDRSSNAQVTQFVAISKFISARIRCFYKRKSVVIYPPIKDFWLEQSLSEHTSCDASFLYAGALVPYKNVHHIIQAFNENGYPLIIAGDGPEKNKLTALAKSNIQFLGKVTDQELANLYKNSRALIFAAKEDFGLIPIESLASGLSVIAPYTGALKESLANIKYWDLKGEDLASYTGVFFRYQTLSLASEIKQGVSFFLENQNLFNSKDNRVHALRFDSKHFNIKWNKLIQELINSGQLKSKI